MREVISMVFWGGFSDAVLVVVVGVGVVAADEAPDIADAFDRAVTGALPLNANRALGANAFRAAATLSERVLRCYCPVTKEPPPETNY